MCDCAAVQTFDVFRDDKVAGAAHTGAELVMCVCQHCRERYETGCDCQGDEGPSYVCWTNFSALVAEKCLILRSLFHGDGWLCDRSYPLCHIDHKAHTSS